MGASADKMGVAIMHLKSARERPSTVARCSECHRACWADSTWERRRGAIVIRVGM